MNHRWSARNSRQAIDSLNSNVEVKIRKYEFSHPDEQKEYIEKLMLSSQFNMRYRGLVEWYGNDLIEYKRTNGSNRHTNEFLRILSKFLTDILKDNCPTSWKDCQPNFWEELIYSAFPTFMKISIKPKESLAFLIQLKRFVHWLDNRTGCSWYRHVEKCADDALTELIKCEQLVNMLYVYQFPRSFQKVGDSLEELEQLNHKLRSYTDNIYSIFEVETISDTIITVQDIESTQVFQITNFPGKDVKPGMLIDGIIVKMQKDFYWTLHYATLVFPNKAKKYIKFDDSH